MNWRKHANLFANGKFKAQINWGDGSKSVKDIKGYFDAYPFEHDFLDSKDYLQAFDLGDTAMPIENCSLIARKIEDMTDGELMRSVNKASLNYCELKKHQWITGASEPTGSQLIRMLEIGVFPFPWDETLIDVKTLEK